MPMPAKHRYRRLLPPEHDRHNGPPTNPLRKFIRGITKKQQTPLDLKLEAAHEKKMKEKGL